MRVEPERWGLGDKLPNEPNFVQAGVENLFSESQKRTQFLGEGGDKDARLGATERTAVGAANDRDPSTSSG